MDLDPHSAIMQQLITQFPHFGETIATDTDIQNQLGLDSLGVATFVTELTSDFELNLEQFAEQIGEIRTVGDLINIFSQSIGSIS